ncbi:MAG: glycosyltransferase family 4 protein [Bacteroidales bacterium]|nr:glycosyltransferase family 4 protein [Bacteroidales bacterium]
MKTVWILLRDITERGGGERVCIQLANAWCDHYDVHLWSFHHGHAQTMAPLDSRVKVTFLSEGFQRAANPLRKAWNKSLLRLYLSFKMCLLIRNNQPDILFCNDGTFMPLFKSAGTSYVRLWHLRCPARRKKVFRRYDAMVVLSGDQLSQWKQYHPAVRVIPNFLPEIPDGLPERQSRTVLSVGRMENSDEKGFMRLLSIWSALQHHAPHPDWKLRIVGSGPFQPQLAAQVRALQLSETVDLHPFTPQIAEEYRNASIYALASYREGFSMVLLESAAWGLPAVAYDIHSGPGDIIAEGENGFLVPDGQSELFVSRLLSLMDDGLLRQRMGLAAQQRARERFAQETVLRQWLALFAALSPEK